MEPSHETEDDLKRLLKSLLLENEPAMVKDTEVTQKKFLSRLAALTQNEDEDLHFGREKTDEIEKLRLQLDKVKPVIKKLVLDLNEARETISQLQENKESTFEKVNLEASLLREKKRERNTFTPNPRIKSNFRPGSSGKKCFFGAKTTGSRASCSFERNRNFFGAVKKT